MPTPSEHKTVQAWILEYADATGWTIVSLDKAEQWRGFDPDTPPKDRAKGRSLFFDDLLNYSNKMKDICCNHRTPWPLDSCE